MEIFIPEELKPVEDEIERLFHGMIYKLRRNKHKGTWQDINLKDSLKRLREEVDELEQAIEENNVVEILLESCDVSNFALITASVAIRRQKIV